MMKIGSANHAHRYKRDYDAVITIEDPRTRRPIRFHRVPHPDHLVMKFEDVDAYDAGLATPDIVHVRDGVAFAREHADGNLLIHCHVGVCRSTAMGLAVIADRMGPGREREAVEALMAGNPDARPNLAMVDMADEVLERGGALSAAWAEIENSSGVFPAYRKKKAKLLEDGRHLFAGRPFDGYYRTLRARPGALRLSRIETIARATAEGTPEPLRTPGP